MYTDQADRSDREPAPGAAATTAPSEALSAPEPDMGVRMRRATPEDVPALVDLVESAYRGERSRDGWTSEADLLDGQRVDPTMLTELLAQPDTTVMLAEAADDGQPVACYELVRTEGGDAYFGMFAVRPKRQGGGLGKQVLAHAERVAAERGCGHVRMTVIRQRGDLIAWYERRGYRRTGAAEPFPYGDERFGVPKRPDLEFVELVKELAAT